ncbi:hypothetical protein M2305_003215 [Gluconobacter cerinus]|nr:hypothetical protein [Gluconobacter cerinus]
MMPIAKLNGGVRPLPEVAGQRVNGRSFLNPPFPSH